MTFDYRYDFGSTTELMITVVNYRIGKLRKEKVVILSRNNPIEFMCEECGRKSAVYICTECSKESMDVESVRRTWEYTLEILKELQ